MAFPVAKTIAIKDAVDHFGKLFGSDLNRKELITYSADLTLIEMNQDHPNWDKVCQAIRSGQATIEQVKQKYNLSKEIENELTKL